MRNNGKNSFNSISYVLILFVPFALLAGTMWLFSVLDRNGGIRSVDRINGKLLIDSSSSLSPQAAYACFDKPCNSIKGIPFNSGYTPYPVWTMLTAPGFKEDKIIRIHHALLDTVDVFIGDSTAFFPYASCGFLTLKRLPALQDISPSFFLPAEYSLKTLMIRIRTTDVCAVSIHAFSLQQFIDHVRKINALFGSYCGAILLMALVNFTLFILIRYFSSFWYALYILSFALFQASSSGTISAFFQNFNPLLLKTATPFFAGLSITLGSLFSFTFLSLDLKNKIKTFYSMTFLLFAIIGILVSFVSVFISARYGSVMVSIIAPVFVMVCILIGLFRIKAIGRPACFYASATSVLALGVVVNACRNFGIVPDTFYTAYSCIFGSAFEFIILAIALADRVASTERENLRVQRNIQNANQLAVESNIKALKSQINPHFLFNTLNTLAELISLFPEKAEKLVLSLSVFYRSTLQASEQQLICLADEIEIIRTYLSIEKERFGSRLDYEITVNGNADEVSFSGLLLQPIVENSIKHGISSLPAGGKIAVHCTISEKEVHIVVQDTGVGFGFSKKTGGTSHGLSNVQERLRLLFGDKASLKCTNENGAKVEIRFPNIRTS
jgi:sensor histidine kinase YesM